MANHEKSGRTQLTLPSMGEDTEPRCGTDNDLPQKLMNWLCCKAAEGSTYTNLTASCDGRRGTLVVASYDEYDRCLAEDVYELHAVEYLLAA